MCADAATQNRSVPCTMLKPDGSSKWLTYLRRREPHLIDEESKPAADLSVLIEIPDRITAITTHRPHQKQFNAR